MKYFGIRKVDEAVIVQETVLYFSPAVQTFLEKSGPWKWNNQVEFRISAAACSFMDLKTSPPVAATVHVAPAKLGARMFLKNPEYVKYHDLLTQAVTELGREVEAAGTADTSITLPWQDLVADAPPPIKAPFVAFKQTKDAVIHRKMEVALSTKLWKFVNNSSFHGWSGAWKASNGLVLCMVSHKSDWSFHPAGTKHSAYPMLYFPNTCREKATVVDLDKVCDYDLIYAALKEVAAILQGRKDAKQAKHEKLFDGLITE
jgi:hypothetical protein